MPPPDYQTLLTVLFALLGGGIFLRVVGKEKHRREKWLQYRLEEKLKELRAKQMESPDGEASNEPITATPTEIES
ncbi:MAG: hypothetical protein KA354_06135 [Phycisphaerae bacterium]|nr:hypothetical protein [Phycisphaerae bacterium]